MHKMNLHNMSFWKDKCFFFFNFNNFVLFGNYSKQYTFLLTFKHSNMHLFFVLMRNLWKTIHVPAQLSSVKQS